MKGWIKLHRQLRDHEIYKNTTALHLWIECMFRASHEDRTVLLKRQKVHLEAGSFVFGYRELSEIAHCSPSSALFWMNYFESERMIERITTSKGTICKLKNWNDFQSTERNSERQANAERTLSESKKKVKKVKNYRSTTENEILKHLKQQGVNNPEAYLSKLKTKADDKSIKKAWSEWKRGAGVESPFDFYNRSLHYSEQKTDSE